MEFVCTRRQTLNINGKNHFNINKYTSKRKSNSIDENVNMNAGAFFLMCVFICIYTGCLNLAGVVCVWEWVCVSVSISKQKMKKEKTLIYMNCLFGFEWSTLSSSFVVSVALLKLINSNSSLNMWNSICVHLCTDS